VEAGVKTMRLRELSAKFIRLQITPPIEHWPRGRPDHCKVQTLAESDGITFLCPKCFKENDGPVGTHGVTCFWRGKVPDWVAPGPGRWNPAGTSLDDLTFVPLQTGEWVSVSVQGCDAHFLIVNGGCQWA